MYSNSLGENMVKQRQKEMLRFAEQQHLAELAHSGEEKKPNLLTRLAHRLFDIAPILIDRTTLKQTAEDCA